LPKPNRPGSGGDRPLKKFRKAKMIKIV